MWTFWGTSSTSWKTTDFIFNEARRSRVRATMEGSEAERKVPKGLEDQAESDRSGASDTRLRSVTARSAEKRARSDTGPERGRAAGPTAPRPARAVGKWSDCPDRFAAWQPEARRSGQGATLDRSEKRWAATPTRAFCAVGGVRSRGVQTIAQRDRANLTQRNGVEYLC